MCADGVPVLQAADGPRLHSLSSPPIPLRCSYPPLLSPISLPPLLCLVSFSSSLLSLLFITPLAVDRSQWCHHRNQSLLSVVPVCAEIDHTSGRTHATVHKGPPAHVPFARTATKIIDAAVVHARDIWRQSDHFLGCQRLFWPDLMVTLVSSLLSPTGGVCCRCHKTAKLLT